MNVGPGQDDSAAGVAFWVVLAAELPDGFRPNPGRPVEWYLSRSQPRVHCWSCTAIALAELAAEAGRFDAVFSDIMMPGMSGIELVQEIDRRYPGLPVVLTSGYSEVLAQSGTHGFELVHKPYSIDALARALRKVSRRR